jgi:GNAT superfamily N-acetyltransferase
MRELEVPEVIEWVGDTTPSLLDAVGAEGSLAVEEIPLMVLEAAPPATDPPDGLTVRMLGPDDEHLLLPASGVAQLAFGPGADQPAGVAERDAAGREPSAAAVALLRSGEARVAVVEHPEHGVLATGRHIPVGPVSEVVGVATLPAEQGRGLAAAVTRALVADAAGLGVRTLFLTASSERVATLYGRLGFRRVGTGYAAERGQH